MFLFPSIRGFACLLTAGLVPAAALAHTAGAAETPAATRALVVQSGPTAVRFKAQIIPEPGRPIGWAIKLADKEFSAKVTATGALMVDATGDENWIWFTRAGTLDLNLGEPEAPRMVRVALDRDPVKGWTYRNQTISLITLGSDQVALIDANSNGRWNEPGVDGVAWSGSTYMFPLPDANETWCTPSSQIQHFSVDVWGHSGSAAVSALTASHPAALTILREINNARVEVGLIPRPEIAALSDPAQKHSTWMRLNRVVRYSETTDSKGFTREGAAAAPTMMLFDKTSPEQVVDVIVNGFQHRGDLFSPGLIGVGIGFDGGYAGLSVSQQVKGRTSMRAPLLYPAPGQTQVGLRYSGDDYKKLVTDNVQPGFMISAYFPSKELILQSARLSMVQGDSLSEVACVAHDPLSSPLPFISKRQQMISILPRQALRSMTTYRVELSATVAGKAFARTWDFTTAERDAVPRRNNGWGPGIIGK